MLTRAHLRWQPRKASARRSSGPGRFAAYGLLAAFGLVAAFPFYWMFIIGSNTTLDATASPPIVTPGTQFLQNAQSVFERVPFGQSIINSILVSSCITVSVAMLSTLAGFAFAKFRFRGRKALFLFVVGTMLLPSELTIVPRYIMMSKFDWIDTLQAVIVPGLVSAYGAFWMKQAIEQVVPDELLDAGRIDGCGYLRLYWHVVLPTTRSAVMALALLTFIFSWNDFLWPAVVLQSTENQTIQVALQRLISVHSLDFAVVLTGTCLAVMPVLVLYAVFARQLVSGLTEGAVKA
jgi:cellobiose transport system permease protein